MMILRATTVRRPLLSSIIYLLLSGLFLCFERFHPKFLVGVHAHVGGNVHGLGGDVLGRMIVHVHECPCCG